MHEADYPYGNAYYQRKDVGQEAIREGFHRLQIQFVDFPVKGETGNAQHFGSQGIIPSTLTERPFDGPAFQFLQVQFLVIEIPGLSFLLRQEEVFGAQDVVLTQDDRPFEDVLKLAYVARPGILQQLVAGFAVQSGDGFMVFPVVGIQEMLGQQDDVFSPFTERRDVQLNPTSGSYFLNGTDVSKFTESQRTNIRKGVIGFVFQSFNLIDELNVYENIELPLLYMGVPSSERKKRVEEAMKRMDIMHRAKHFPQQLSGGQQQRVAIARAVVANPKLILADEPTGNLDSKNGKEVMELLSELHKEGTTIVMVTHSKHDAGYAGRIINLFDGEVVAELNL